MSRRTRERVEIDGVPAELRAAATERGWPDGLLERALEAGVPPGNLHAWLDWRTLDAADLERRISWHEQLTVGPLQAREVATSDNDAFCDLWAHSPEAIGDVELTTLRGPNGFAQFRLQEGVNLQVIADGNVLAASCGWAARKVVVAGQRLTVRYGQALRVHRDYRRRGFGDAVRSFAHAMNAMRPSATQYDIMRSGNFAVVGWWEKHIPGFFEGVPERKDDVPGVPVTVHQIPAQASTAATKLRPTRPDDLQRCVELINRTHAGLDLFRPHTVDFLEDRLDEGYWGERAPWWPHVYGWEDHQVLESNGRIVACAGLWDRGRDQRDRFRNPKTGEERIVSDTALMDWGFEDGAEDAMIDLIDQLRGHTHALGRDFLLAPVEQAPGVLERIAAFDAGPEIRSLRWALPGVALERPYTDLAYW